MFYNIKASKSHMYMTHTTNDTRAKRYRRKEKLRNKKHNILGVTLASQLNTI